MAFTVSIGPIDISIRGNNAENTTAYYGRQILALGQAGKEIALERLRNLLDRYDAYQAEKHRQFVYSWPPHSLFCEKRCCQRSFRSYHRFLKQELVWNKDGHLQ